MPSLSWRAAKAVCCRAWAITPTTFDELVDAGELSLADVIAQVDLEILGNPRLVGFTHPGFLERMKQRQRDEQNAAAFAAMWEMAQKQAHKKKGAKK